MKNKRGQEEIIGLVVIVVIVMIVLLVFLTFIFKNTEKPSDEKELKNFLDSAVLYTTSCEQNTGFLDMKDLIIACNNNEDCFDNNSCIILENTVKDILKITSNVGDEEEIKGQNVDIFYRYKNSTNVLINIKRGSCLNNGTTNAAENIYPSGQGVVGINIKECY